MENIYHTRRKFLITGYQEHAGTLNVPLALWLISGAYFTDLSMSIKACCILHNYVRARDGYRYEDTLFQAPLLSLHEGNAPRGGMSANSARDKYADYFINEGKLAWQDGMV